MSDNLYIYNAVRTVPSAALREIQAGRLKGKSDINPMWRIKALTEQFGPCGVGWRYAIMEKRLERGANDEIAAFVDINLWLKIDGEWTAPIPGTGGSAFVAKEARGMHTNDECFKMALTDAISVACKALGVGADVYWGGDRTKYDKPEQGSTKKNEAAHDDDWQAARDELITLAKQTGMAKEMPGIIKEHYGADKSDDMTLEQLQDCIRRVAKEAMAGAK